MLWNPGGKDRKDGREVRLRPTARERLASPRIFARPGVRPLRISKHSRHEADENSSESSLTFKSPKIPDYLLPSCYTPAMFQYNLIRDIRA